MHKPAILLALAALSTALAASQPPATAPAQPSPPEQPRPQLRPWPVHIVDSNGHPACHPPMVVVGSLFTGGYCFREDDAGTIHRTPAGQITLPVRNTDNKYSRVATEYLLGNIRPRPSCNDEETCVFVTSPPLDAFDEFRIDSIIQEDTTFTLYASYWRDDSGQRWGPGPNHSAQLVRLGWLPPGDYTLQFRLNDRYCTTGGKHPALYADNGVRVGQTKFTVAKADAWNFHTWDQPTSTSTIREDALSSPSKIPSLSNSDPAKATLRQQPYFAARRVPSNGAKSETTAVVTITPNLDWHKHSQAAATLWTPSDPAPQPDPKAPPTLVARISGGTPHILGKYDWADISAVEWKGTTVTVYISTWRKDYIHGNNTVADFPEFAVPLESAHLDPDPVKTAASIKVEVVWQNGIDNPRNAVEEVRH